MGKKARQECQSYKLTVEDPVSLEYITRHVAGMKQRYTQSSGRRPFGISCLLTGFDDDGTPHLYQTDPAGVYAEWKANAIGRNAKTVREFLEKNWTSEAVETEEGATKLAVKALLEVVQLGGKNLEVAVMRKGDNPKQMQSMLQKSRKKKKKKLPIKPRKKAALQKLNN